MGNFESSKRSVTVYFLIDVSGSMDGEKMDNLNNFFRELIPEIKEIPTEDTDIQAIKIAVLEYSSGATWITSSGPVPADEFNWKNVYPGGVTDLGAALKTLNEKLSASKGDSVLNRLFILFTDGSPTDMWKAELAKLKENEKFKNGMKIGIPIGDIADIDVLNEFTGSKELVSEKYYNINQICGFIYKSMTAYGTRASSSMP